MCYTKKKQRSKNAPNFNLEQYCFQLADGVDLLQVEGIGLDFILTLLAEVGLDLSQFPTQKHFVSWLGLAPNQKVSGGKVISAKVTKNKQRLRQSFRVCAVGLAKRKNGNPLTQFYWRKATQKGKGTAVIATARKLAIIVYNMLKHKQPYEPQRMMKPQQQSRKRKIKNIQRTINKLGITPEELHLAKA